MRRLVLLTLGILLGAAVGWMPLRAQVNNPTRPCGASGSLQYNNAGLCGGFGSWDGTNLDLAAGSLFRVALSPPANPTATSGTDGALAAGTYYFKIVASDGTGTTTGSTQVSATIAAPDSGSGSVALTWDAVPGAYYRVYKGTSSNGQDRYQPVNAYSQATTGSGVGLYTYTTDAGAVMGTVPATNTALSISQPFRQSYLNLGLAPGIIAGNEAVYYPASLDIASNDAGTGGAMHLWMADPNGYGSFLEFFTSRGTLASPTVPSNNDYIASLDFYSWNGTRYEYGAQQLVYSGGTVNMDGSVDSNLSFSWTDGSFFNNTVYLRPTNGHASIILATGNSYSGLEQVSGGIRVNGDFAGSVYGSVTASDFIVSGSRFKSDTTTGHTGGLCGYDVDDAVCRDILTWTNGNAVTAVLATPTGGTLSGDFSSLAVAGKSLILSGTLTTTGAFNPTFAIPSSSTWTFPSGGGTLSTTTGTVTSIATTSPITGGTITSTGTIACATCGVTGSPLSQFAAGTVPGLTGPVTITEAVGSSGLTITGATQTNSFPALSLTQTWNASGTTFTLIKGAITSTASAAGSLFLDLTSVGVNNRVQISKLGTITLTSAGSTNNTISIGNTDNHIIAFNSNGLGESIRMLGDSTGSGGPGEIRLNSTAQVGFTAGQSSAGLDTILTRGGAAATFQFGADVNGAAVSQMLQSANGITGTDKTGGNLTLASGKGTGAGAVSSLIFQTPTVLTTGTTAQSLATRLTLTSTAVTFVPPIIASTAGFATGIFNDGSGLKHTRTTTGSVSGGSTALVTITWGTTFADANYTASCSVEEATTSSLSMSVQHIESHSATQLAVRVLNNAVGALTGTVNCIAIHD